MLHCKHQVHCERMVTLVRWGSFVNQQQTGQLLQISGQVHSQSFFLASIYRPLDSILFGWLHTHIENENGGPRDIPVACSAGVFSKSKRILP